MGDTQQQSIEVIAKETTADGAFNDAQVVAVLAQHLGQQEGTAFFKGRDVEVQAEFPLTNFCRWIEEGKLIEMHVTEDSPQGDN